MSFEFIDPADAQRQRHLLIAFAGESGSGKTFSAMELASGMMPGDDPFAFIDTENRRGLAYAEEFKFRHGDLQPPFTPERYAEAIKAADAAGFKVIVIDSMSHEHMGIGGLMEIAEKSSGKGPGAWKDAKKRHNHALMQTLLNTNAHVIMCFRAKDKIKIEGGGRDMNVQSLGITPQTEKHVIYEMTLSLTFYREAPGVVRLDDPRVFKMPDKFKAIFKPGEHVSASMGAHMAAWSRYEPIPEPNLDLWRRARNAAQGGMATLKSFAASVSNAEAAELRIIGQELRQIAARSDANNQDMTP